MDMNGTDNKFMKMKFNDLEEKNAFQRTRLTWEYHNKRILTIYVEFIGLDQIHLV
jgi:hypothetical protein